jgi:3-oxoacyl-ACP reductase-like protein
MFIEQRLESFQRQLDSIEKMVAELLSRGPAQPLPPAAAAAAPASAAPTAPAVPAGKTPDVQGELARIKAALMSLKDRGGRPAEVLQKVGISRLSEVTTVAQIEAIDSVLRAA